MTTDMPDFQIPGLDLIHDRPLIMGILNATTNSFSDAGRYPTLQSRLTLATQLLEEGADILDVGGQSANTVDREISSAEEIDLVLPLLEGLLRRHPGTIVSIDTYKPAVAQAALRAGARIINDISGLRNPEIAELVADHQAGLVVTHTRARPKQRLADSDLYSDVANDVVQFLTQRVRMAVDLRVDLGSIIVDPGPDFSKTPHQTVEVLRNLSSVEALGRPLLLALSRKDFIGAITGRRPADRLAGTLGAIAALGARGNYIYRVHDVGYVKDFFEVWAVLEGRRTIPRELELPLHLRRESTRDSASEGND